MIQIGNAKIYSGDCIEIMQGMPDESVHCCITSPPYFGLRDYHAGPKMIGLEPTFQQWLDKMVAVSAELWRVLRDDGTYWLNCGDAYWNTPPGKHPGGFQGQAMKDNPAYNEAEARHNKGGKHELFKPKDLLMMPARLAIALQEAGWYIRSEIIWAKPNPMPESVRDRPTSSHEKIYLLTKKPRYFYDADAVREKSQDLKGDRTGESFGKGRNVMDHSPDKDHVMRWNPSIYEPNPSGRNQRNVWKIYDPNNDEVVIYIRAKRKDLKKYGFRLDAMPQVWNIATKPYPDAHFATFPPEIPRRCIMAGTSERGCCPECGNQWERVVEKDKGNYESPSSWDTGPGSHGTINKHGRGGGNKKHSLGSSGTGTSIPGHKGNLKADGSPISPERKTVGWSEACDHGREPIPSTVLDIFAGSGTTLEVALSLNRKAIGIELNPEYVKLMTKRIMKEALQEKLNL